MAWLVGIDEAGYGPNLGPFVMTLIACRVPDARRDACLWETLRTRVRRFDEPADDRLIVADSKQVYAPARGWEDLERTVLAALPDVPAALGELVGHIAGDDVAALKQEAWFVGDTALPTAVDAADLADARSRLADALASAPATIFCRSAIVPAPRFNDLIDRWDSKGAVLGIALSQLIQACLAHTAAEPMRFVIDKHGGRNTYAALLQHAFADGIVLAESEGRDRSAYRVDGLDRDVHITFMPRADVEHFPVALASMVSKYQRELLMREFNRFWQTHVPGLKPTAGYPNDAVRFLDTIRPALARLGIAERAVWRCR